MNYFPNTPLGRFRFIAVIEGLSYLFLLFVAMPFKYWLGEPGMVTYTGWVHGALFMMYILTLISAGAAGRWSVKKKFYAFLASLIPFASFVLERKLRRQRLSTLETGEARAA